MSSSGFCIGCPFCASVEAPDECLDRGFHGIDHGWWDDPRSPPGPSGHHRKCAAPTTASFTTRPVGSGAKLARNATTVRAVARHDPLRSSGGDLGHSCGAIRTHRRSDAHPDAAVSPNLPFRLTSRRTAVAETPSAQRPSASTIAPARNAQRRRISRGTTSIVAPHTVQRNLRTITSRTSDPLPSPHNPHICRLRSPCPWMARFPLAFRAAHPHSTQ